MPASVVGAARSEAALGREHLERFALAQPALSRFLRQRFEQPLDAAALALGQALAASVFVAFEAAFAERLGIASEDAVSMVELSLSADEALRQTDPMDALDSEDIVGIEQPALVAFVNEQLDQTLEQHARSIDVDHVAVIFRAVLIQILVLSQAVAPPPGFTTGRGPEPLV